MRTRVSYACTNILNHLPSQALLVCYETLCNESEIVWKSLVERIDVVPDSEGLKFSGALHEINQSLPADLLERANILYNDMLNSAVGNKSDFSSPDEQGVGPGPLERLELVLGVFGRGVAV